MMLGPPWAHLGALKGPKEAEMAIIFIFLISWINLRQNESVAYQWSHMKDKLMQTIEQSGKNDAGAPMGPLGAPKGPKEAEMAIIFIFLIFRIDFWQIESVAWQWYHKKDNLMQIIKKIHEQYCWGLHGPI